MPIRLEEISQPLALQFGILVVHKEDDMQYSNSSPSYGKSDADDRADDLAASLFNEMPEDYQKDWAGFRDRVMGKRQ